MPLKKITLSLKSDFLKPNFFSVVVKSLSCIRLCYDLWIVARQAPLSMEFSRQEYYSELPFPGPGDLSNLESELASPASAGGFFTTVPPGKPNFLIELGL